MKTQHLETMTTQELKKKLKSLEDQVSGWGGNLNNYSPLMLDTLKEIEYLKEQIQFEMELEKNQEFLSKNFKKATE